MVSVTYSEAILLIAALIAASLFAGVVLSKLGAMESAYSQALQQEKSRFLMDIKIIYAASNSSKVYVWVKNVGVSPISSLESLDVYFGEYSQAQYIPFNSSSPPTWHYSFYDDDQLWKPGETIKITIDLSQPLQSGVYYLKVATGGGVSDEYVFST